MKYVKLTAKPGTWFVAGTEVWHDEISLRPHSIWAVWSEDGTEILTFEIDKSDADLISELVENPQNNGAKEEILRRLAMIDPLLNHCDKESGECSECSKIVCPYNCDFHFHHDGCPACAELELV